MNNSRINHIKDNAFKYFGIFCTLFGILVLGYFLVNIAIEGIARINWQFISSLPSRMPAKAGILPALVGTLWILFLTALIAIPVGVGAGVYLEEYAKKNR